MPSSEHLGDRSNTDITTSKTTQFEKSWNTCVGALCHDAVLHTKNKCVMMGHARDGEIMHWLHSDSTKYCGYLSPVKHDALVYVPLLARMSVGSFKLLYQHLQTLGNVLLGASAFASAHQRLHENVKNCTTQTENNTHSAGVHGWQWQKNIWIWASVLGQTVQKQVDNARINVHSSQLFVQRFESMVQTTLVQLARVWYCTPNSVWNHWCNQIAANSCASPFSAPHPDALGAEVKHPSQVQLVLRLHPMDQCAVWSAYTQHSATWVLDFLYHTRYLAQRDFEFKAQPLLQAVYLGLHQASGALSTQHREQKRAPKGAGFNAASKEWGRVMTNTRLSHTVYEDEQLMALWSYESSTLVQKLQMQLDYVQGQWEWMQRTVPVQHLQYVSHQMQQLLYETQCGKKQKDSKGALRL